MAQAGPSFEQVVLPHSFEQVVLPHLDAAHNLARWLVSDPALAQDVTQDAALRALGYFASYAGGDARAWLLRIVRNTAYDALAARRDMPSSLDTSSLDAAGEGAEQGRAMQPADPADDPEAALSRRQSRAQLESALAALPVELRECVLLRELEQLSYKQIATITGAPIGTVMSRLWRGRRALAGAVAP